MKSLASELLKKLGMSIASFNIAQMSMPIRFFESRSDTDRIWEMYRILNHYLLKAYKTKDKLERIKLVSVGIIGSYYTFLRKRKAFNPLLGETW